MAIAYWRDNDYQNSLEIINNAYHQLQLAPDHKQLAKVLNTLGLIYWRLGNNDDALDSYSESAKIAEKYSQHRLLGLTHTNRGLIFKEQALYQKAILHNNKAIQLFQHYNLYKELGIALNNQGQIFKKQKKYKIAENYYLKALENYKKVSYKDGESATYYNLADVYLHQGAVDEALKASQNSLKFALAINRKIRISEAYSKISESYERLGNLEQAFKYHKLYSLQNDTISQVNQSKILAQYQTKMGVELKNLQIQNLQNEQKLAKNKLWFLAIGIGILVLIGFFLSSRYLTKINYNKKRLEIELEASKKILNVKELELKTYIIDLSKKNELINKLQAKANSYTLTTKNDNEVAQLKEQKILTSEDWNTFKNKFNSIYPGFNNRIMNLKVPLTEAEIRFLVLFHLNLTSKQMSNTLGISPQSVRACKMRLKKKLKKYHVYSIEEIITPLIR
ncbi:tetratricopeptide repeat protein [Winogradskyella vidalii]|uniref:tetratricopeptide repeat protein n=1 Tax=Winogradskyella vidalii TaxID=2615024 RepID=UPI0015C6C534|nr:tetratricopeptide repeat protein [Winogradskyella vidalii]